MLDWHSIGESSILSFDNFQLNLFEAQSNVVVQPTTLVQKCAIPVVNSAFKLEICFLAVLKSFKTKMAVEKSSAEEFKF